MKRLSLATLSLALMIGFLWTQTSCSRNATPAHYKGRQLIMGSGGGITGFRTTYYLLENRRLFVRNERDTVFTFLKRQPGTITRQLFRMTEDTCAIKTTNFDHPGNTYKFAQWKKREESYKVTWGDIGGTVPASYPRLYTSFMTMLPVSKTLD
jgi:hypothetical protein